MLLISVGGWYVGNTAVLEWLDQHEKVIYLRGDLHLFREKNGVFDCLSSSSYLNRQRLIFILIVKVLKRVVAAYIKRNKKTYFANLEFTALLIRSLLRSLFLSRDKTVLLWAGNFQKYANDRVILLQNPFFYDSLKPDHSRIWRRVFVDAYFLFVTRDPYDQYEEINRNSEFDKFTTVFRRGAEGKDRIGQFNVIVKRGYSERFKLIREFPNYSIVVSFEAFAKEREGKRIEHAFGLDQINGDFDFNFTRSNVGIASTVIRQKKIDPDIFTLKAEMDEIRSEKWPRP